MSDLINVAIGLVWAAGLLVASGYTLWIRVSDWHRKPDERNIRSLLTEFASALTAVSFAAALVASVVIDLSSTGITLRGLLFTVGLGMFTGMKVLSADDLHHRRVKR